MCEIDGDSLEHASVWSERERTARKRYRCSSCGGRIQVGERYLNHFSVIGGDPYQEKMCLPCRDARNEFSGAHSFGAVNPGGFPDLLRDCIAEGEKESEERWTPMLEAMGARRELAKAAE